MRSARNGLGVLVAAATLGLAGCSNAGFKDAQDNNWVQDDEIEGCFDSSQLNYSDTTLTGNGKPDSDFTRIEFTFTDKTDDDVRIQVDVDGDSQPPAEISYNTANEARFISGRVNIPQGANRVEVTAHPKSSISVDSCKLVFER